MLYTSTVQKCAVQWDFVVFKKLIHLFCKDALHLIKSDSKDNCIFLFYKVKYIRGSTQMLSCTTFIRRRNVYWAENNFLEWFLKDHVTPKTRVMKHCITWRNNWLKLFLYYIISVISFDQIKLQSWRVYSTSAPKPWNKMLTSPKFLNGCIWNLRPCDIQYVLIFKGVIGCPFPTSWYSEVEVWDYLGY